MLEVKLVRTKRDNKPIILVKQNNRAIFLTKTTFEQLKKKVEEILPQYEQQKLDWYSRKQQSMEYYESIVKGGVNE